MGALLAAALLLSGCGAPGPEGETGARWWKGNLHTHTLWSDGDDFPEMALSWYRERGYDFVALSDHNVLQEGERWVTVDSALAPARREYVERFGEEWVEERTEAGSLRVRLRTLDEIRPALEEPGEFLVIRSEEITDRFESKPLHVNATNLEELIEPRGGSSVREVLQNDIDAVLEQRRRTGRPMIPHVNHPNFGWAVTVDDLAALEGERFFEVYNGHPAVRNEGDPAHPSTEGMWDRVLTRRLREGRPPLYGLAVDDAHHYHRAGPRTASPGRGWVVVRAPALEPGALIDALEAGDFYASSGVELVDVRRSADGLRIRIRPEEGVGYTTRFFGTRRDAPGEVGVVLEEVEGAEARYRFRGDELYVRAKIVSTRVKENPYREGEHEAAWVQPAVPGGA